MKTTVIAKVSNGCKLAIEFDTLKGFNHIVDMLTDCIIRSSNQSEADILGRRISLPTVLENINHFERLEIVNMLTLETFRAIIESEIDTVTNRRKQ